MANEAIIVELLGNRGDPVDYTVADGTAITKGTLMELTDPRSAVKVTGAGVVLAGISAVDKEADDGQVNIPVYKNGIFALKISAGGTTVLGSGVRSAGSDNTVTVATTLDNETGKSVGSSQETGGNADVVEVRVNL